MVFGQDVGAMIEARNAREWEDQENRPELDCYGVYYKLGAALDCVSDAGGILAKAEKQADGFPVAHRIGALADDVANLTDAIERIRKELMREVKSA